MEKLTLTLVTRVIEEEGEDPYTEWVLDNFEGPEWLTEEALVGTFSMEDWMEYLPTTREAAVADQKWRAKRNESISYALQRRIDSAKARVRSGEWQVADALDDLREEMTDCPVHFEELTPALEMLHEMSLVGEAKAPTPDRLHRRGRDVWLRRQDGMGYLLVDFVYHLGLAKSRQEAAYVIAQQGVNIGGRTLFDPWDELPLGPLTGEQIEVALRASKQVRIVKLEGDLAAVNEAIRPYAGAEARS